MSDNQLPIGRRVAQLRARRGMSQQLFADRIGKSKSWVEKVERGLRSLDKFSTIETVAGALGVAPEILLNRNARREPIADVGTAVERVRAALACYDTPAADASPGQAPSAEELDGRVGHAWAAYRHAHHPQVLRLLPDLLSDAGHACHAGTSTGREPAAAGDPRRTALAVIPLTQALRVLDRGRLAMTAAITAVQRFTPAPSRQSPPDDLALVGTMLIQAALAAANCDDAAAARDLTAHSARLAHGHGDRPHHDSAGTGFGPTVVDLARALIVARLGDSRQAITLHLRATGGDAWNRLPAEHRAAHLIDITRAYLDLGDPRAAGRALVTADRIAPAEIRARPAAHVALTAVLRAGRTPADVTHLATAIGIIRR